MPSKLTAALNRNRQPDRTAARQRLNASTSPSPTDDADLTAAFAGKPAWQVISVERATQPVFSQRAITIAQLPAGQPRANAARERVKELRQSRAWLDESHVDHKDAVREIHALYDFILEDQGY